MIRPLALVDTLSIATLKGPDWAIRPSGVRQDGILNFAPAPFLWRRLRFRRSSIAWVSFSGRKVSGLVSARPRSGPTVWWVDHMVVPHQDETSGYGLLDKVAAQAGSRGAQRIFLALPEEWHLQETARHCGYLPCVQIFQLALLGRSTLIGVNPETGFRDRQSGDDHALFRLYNATTPSGVRSSFGLTLQQWKDAQEAPTRRTKEFVLEQDGEVKAWVRLDHSNSVTRVRLTVHGDWRGEQMSLVSFILKERGPHALRWDVPEYQEDLRIILNHVGLEDLASYQVMIKPLTARVSERKMAPAHTWR